MNIEEHMSIAEHVLAKWDGLAGKMDWLGLETCLVDVLRSDFNPVDKVALAKEAVDAYTRRGHFQPTEYYWNPTKACSPTAVPGKGGPEAA